MKKKKKVLSKKRVAAGGIDVWTREIVFTKTFEEVEGVDFHHSGVIPFEYLEKVESNEIIYFYVCASSISDHVEVNAWMMRWEDGLHTEKRYEEIEEEILSKLKGMNLKLR